MVYDTNAQTVQPTMPPEHVLHDVRIDKEEDQRVNFEIQRADCDFVAESLEMAVCRRKAHRNSTFNLNTKSFGVTSFEHAIGRSSVEVRDQGDRFLAGTQHGWETDRIAWPGIGIPLGEADSESQLLPAPEGERRLFRNVHHERVRNARRPGL